MLSLWLKNVAIFKSRKMIRWCSSIRSTVVLVVILIFVVFRKIYVVESDSRELYKILSSENNFLKRDVESLALSSALINKSIKIPSERRQLSRRIQSHHADDNGLFSLSVTNRMLDTFKMRLPTLPNYRNPCWYEALPRNFTCYNSYYGQCVRARRDHGKVKKFIRNACEEVDALFGPRQDTGEPWRLRCFPYFFVLGVQKCGTTPLYRDLVTHFEEFVPGMIKELHFWDFKRNPPDKSKPKCYAEPEMKFSSYLDAFDLAAEKIRTEGVHTTGIHDIDRAYHPLFTGDLTPSTLTSHFGWEDRPGNEGRSTPKYTTADYIHHLYPDVKLIIIVRDPVQRMYSNFQMKEMTAQFIQNRTLGHISFLEEVKKTVSDFQNCSQYRSTSACAYGYHGFGTTYMLTRGLYEVYIRDWWRVFPREQLFIFTTEEYKSNRLKILLKLNSFLNVAPFTTKKIWEIENEDPAKLQRSTTPERNERVDVPMDPEARQILQNFYSPHNHRLAQLLGNNKYTWGY